MRAEGFASSFIPPPSSFHTKGYSHGHSHLTETWQNTLDAIRTWARINSPWAIHYNSGSCNGCDIEILATLTPRYDVERFGVKLQGSPRHADVLICTGPVTLQSRDRLKRIYEQMPEPKFVVAVGSCAISGGVFQGCYNVVGHIDQVIPGERLRSRLPAASGGDHRRRGEVAAKPAEARKNSNSRSSWKTPRFRLKGNLHDYRSISGYGPTTAGDLDQHRHAAGAQSA